jgi:dUTPase
MLINAKGTIDKGYHSLGVALTNVRSMRYVIRWSGSAAKSTIAL